MGVYKLGAKFLSKLPPGRGKAKPLNKLPRIDVFMVDSNGILHNVAQRTFGYKGGVIDSRNKDEKRAHEKRVKEVDGIPWLSLMIEYKEMLFDELDKLMDISQPTKAIILAVDGVAPAAKIVQQRVRRIGGSENVSTKIKNPSENKANTGFSSTMITPGTEFMIMVDSYIHEWITISKKANPKIHHVYSPYTIDGEGEHKVFEILEKLKIGHPKDTYAIEGLDSDLISLMILRPQRFISIKSERGQFIELNEIKQYILESTRSNEKNLDPILTLKDFVVMIMSVGNDFIPKFNFVEDVGEAINMMMSIHLRYIATNLTTHEDSINWSSFSIFLQELKKYEQSELMQASQDKYYYPDPLLHNREIEDYAINNENAKFISKFSRDYYNAALLPKIGKNMIKHSLDDEISNMCYDMCEGLSWVLKYYTASNYSKLYIYPRQSAPLIKDLYEYVNEFAAKEVTNRNIKNNGGSTSFNYISQLMTVMPLSKNDLIPMPYKDDVIPGGQFGHLIPIGFPVKKEKLKEYKDWFMEKPVLPLPDINKIISYVNMSGSQEIPGVLINLR
jgi:5'-3' exonuclease